MNNVEWTPTWPAPPPDNIRQEEFSSTYSGLSPSLPNQEMTVSLEKIQVRENASINQQPNSDNGYQIKVTFDDKGAGSSADYHVCLKITYNVPEGNDPPIANGQNVTTEADTKVAITLTATGVAGKALTYPEISEPKSGTLSGTAPNLTYMPNPGFSGNDRFTFKANDGQNDSNTATMEITVLEPNVPPVADDLQVTIDEGRSISINLSASDENGDNLTYTVGGDGHAGSGTLSGTAPNLIYTPNAGFMGEDTFTYNANDSKADSNTAKVTIIVTERTFRLNCSWVTSNAGKSDTNYARGRPTKCNSDESGDCQRSSYVVDGSGSRWSSDRNDPGPDQTNPYYVMVDLEQVRTLNKVEVNLDIHRQNFSVFVSTDLSNWNSIGSGTDQNGIQTYEFASKQVRYIKFESYYSSDAGQVNVHQISAYGPVGTVEPETAAEVVNIPDANLRAALELALGINAGEDITKEALAGLERLDAGVREITNLSGLEHCTSLTFLGISQNHISDISPLTNLTYLDFGDNKLSNVSPLANLTTLYLHDNQISDISAVANLTNLTRLDLSSNPITDVSPLANLPSLAELYLGNNQLTDISDISSLTTLLLSNNQISDISPPIMRILFYNIIYILKI